MKSYESSSITALSIAPNIVYKNASPNYMAQWF